MGMFDLKGMMIFPTPEKLKKACKMKELIVIQECFCPKGHNLTSNQAVFDNLNGIVLKVKVGDREGHIALSPVFGIKQRVSIGINLKKDELLEILCPECSTPLPVYSACNCGGNLITLFLNLQSDYTNSVLICNRVDCQNAQIRAHNEVANYDDFGNVIFV